MSDNQWLGLYANLGVWHGEFIHLSPQLVENSRNPSCITLTLCSDRHIEQTVAVGTPAQTQVFQITSLKKGLVFFPTGAFSQGSLQWAPFSDFGIELSLLAQHERRRLVALYQYREGASHLASLTFIPERRQISDPSLDDPSPSEPAPPLTWQSEAIAIDEYWQHDTVQTAFTPEWPLLKLSHDSSCALPLIIPQRQAFTVSLSWQVTAIARQHIVRHYSETGAWRSLVWYCESAS